MVENGWLYELKAAGHIVSSAVRKQRMDKKVETGLFPTVRLHVLNNVINKKQVFKHMSPGRTSYFPGITLNILKYSSGELILGSCDSASGNGPQLDANKHFA